MVEMQISEPGAGERLDIMGAPMVLKAGGGPVPLFIADHVVPPGYMVPPHVHDHDDEVLFILEGRLTLLTDDGEVAVAPGACAQLPRGSRHGFRNDTETPVRFLAMALPGIQAAEMFRHFDRAGRAAGELQPAEIGAIASQYGVAIG